MIVGDRVRLYDGTQAVVLDIQCSQCELRVPHATCTVFVQVGPRRWISDRYIETP